MNSPTELLYLSRADVESLKISMKEIIRIVEETFIEKASGKTEAPPKPGVHPKMNAFIHAMPAFIQKTRAVGVKWVSGFPTNPERGLPYISGLVVLNDPDTGFPICIMDCTWITAKRTGAATAVAAKHLARKDPRVLSILGCGVQGRSNLEALALICKNLELVKAYDVSEKNLRRYVEEMTEAFGITIMPAKSPREAVRDSDVAVTSGPILQKPRPIIEKSWFKNGGLACPLDFDSYWKPEAMHSMQKFITDDRNQLAYYRSQGYFADIPEVYAELGEIVAGFKPGRANPEERIMAMNLGLAVEDVATAAYVYRKASKAGVGKTLLL